MRSTLICPKCQHNHILWLAAVADLRDYGTNPGFLNIALVPLAKKKFMTDQNLESAGHVQAAVCRSCGYTEFYTQDPQSIPVDGQYVRECVGPSTPFR